MRLARSPYAGARKFRANNVDRPQKAMEPPVATLTIPRTGVEISHHAGNDFSHTTMQRMN